MRKSQLMSQSPQIGVGLHWLGGLAAASFYVFYRGVRHWSWETYWLIGGMFSWLVAPWILGFAFTEDLLGVLIRSPGSALFWAWFFGALWGLGGLTFGLTMRFLGVSLGYGLALGICAVFGTLLPPAFKGTMAGILANPGGRVTILGLGVCVIGILVSSLAGLSKEHELARLAEKNSTGEFNFKKGTAVALFCGIMSACMAFGLDAAEPIAIMSAAAGTSPVWTGLPKLVIVLLGGLTSNAIWCVILGLRNRTIAEYTASASATGDPMPRFANLGFCALAGVTWYLQFFFYTMGETHMGAFAFSSWTLHMASIIIFSMIWGAILREWRGTSTRTHVLLASGVTILVLSTVVVGFGNYLAAIKR